MSRCREIHNNRAVGTPLHLKQRFGVGYHLNLVVDPARTEIVNETVRKMLPGWENKSLIV